MNNVYIQVLSIKMAGGKKQKTQISICDEALKLYTKLCLV